MSEENVGALGAGSIVWMPTSGNASGSIAKLTDALSKAQGAFDHAKKDVANEFFKSKYADLASVIDAAKKPLADNGLAVIQTTEIEGDAIVLVTLLSHSSGEWIKGRYPVKPVKNDPQGLGSALTYARRYAFSAITGIASEDDDGNAASGKVKEPRFKTAKAMQDWHTKVKADIFAAESVTQLVAIYNANIATVEELEANKSNTAGVSTNDQIAAEDVRHLLSERRVALEKPSE